MAHLTFDKIKPHHVTGHLQKHKESGKASRTCNLALVVLRNVFNSAKLDRFVKSLPVDGIPWQRCETKARRLYPRFISGDVLGDGCITGDDLIFQ